MGFSRADGAGVAATTHADGALDRYDLTPARVTAIYLVFGFVALVFSDVALERVVSNPLLGTLQTAKGAVEVLVTAALVYVLTRRSRAQVTDANERLARQREQLDVLHRVLRHNLRNEMTVVGGHADSIERKTDSAAIAEQSRAVGAAARNTMRYADWAHRIRDIAASGTERVDVARAVRDCLADHEALGDAVTVRTALPERAPVVASRMLPDALEELVANAVAHNDDPEPTVEVRVAVAGGQARVEVHDDGPGVPETVRRVILSDDRDQLAHLDGLGLWFVYWTATASGGTVDVGTSELGGASVCLSLPTAGDD